MNVKFFDPGKAYLKIKAEIDAEMQRVLAAGDLILRDDVEKFEKNLAEFVGTKYAVALNSGTDALYLALKALGILPGDKVAVPSYTFVATAQVVAQNYAIPVLYDLGEEAKGDFKAYMVSHMEGALSPLPLVNCPIIEDAAQALGAVKNPLTTAQCWSFYPAKILGAYGDAGALTTNDGQIYNYVKEARNHFKTNGSQWGINSRMDNLQAAILNVKFKYLPEVLARRKEIAEIYAKGLSELVMKGFIKLPWLIRDRVWQDYIIRTQDRNGLYIFLKANDIETLKNNYPFPISKLPLSIAYEEETLRLPCNETVIDEEIEYIISKIKEFYGK